MTILRRSAVVTLLLVSAACGNNSSAPGSPSPVPSGPPESGGTVTTVTIPMGAAALGNRAFIPDAIKVAVGDTVKWINTDVVAHTSTADAAAWNSGTLAPGQQFSTTLSVPGTFAYHCAIHPGMVGSVVVR
jgi:plastocyanin